LDGKERIPVAVTCRAQGLSMQASYAWKNNPLSRRPGRDAPDQHRWTIHPDDPAFWYRFIVDVLAQAGHKASENRVAHVCSAEHPTAEVKLDLCAIKVVCPAWIVGYSRRGGFSARR
jgi:hypothetical protein